MKLKGALVITTAVMALAVGTVAPAATSNSSARPTLVMMSPSTTKAAFSMTAPSPTIRRAPVNTRRPGRVAPGSAAPGSRDGTGAVQAVATSKASSHIYTDPYADPYTGLDSNGIRGDSLETG